MGKQGNLLECYPPAIWPQISNCHGEIIYKRGILQYVPCLFSRGALDIPIVKAQPRLDRGISKQRRAKCRASTDRCLHGPALQRARSLAREGTSQKSGSVGSITFSLSPCSLHLTSQMIKQHLTSICLCIMLFQQLASQSLGARNAAPVKQPPWTAMKIPWISHASHQRLGGA